MRLQNSIIYPDLYNGEFFQERAETIVRLDDFLHFLDQPAQKAVRAAIQDPSFPCNVPEEHWSWDTLWSSSADLPKLFRLAILHPAENPETSIKCSLINESLVNFPVYEALSWVWGMSDLVDIQVNGCEFPIPTTLLHSLRALRRKTEHRIVWIDSLTIDMKNWTERGQQVAMMAEIYGSARNTILYMGDGDPDTSLAIEGICRRDKSMITEAINDSGAFTRGIRNIIGRQIWRRTWIIQEVVVAKDSVCSCGMHEIHWTDLSEALEDYGQQLFFKAREWQSVPDDLQELFQSWQAFRSFASISKRWVSKNLLLPELLHLTRFHRTSLRCDMLFGLCSLLQPEEAENPLLAVNYTLSEAEVFTRLATYIITKYRNLDILSFSGFNYSLDPRETSPDWPSWVAMNFVADTFSPGIFDPQQPKIYNAGGRQLREFDISIDSMRLSVEGILIDSIAHVIPLLVPEVSNEKSGTSETGEPVFQRNDIDMKCILDNLHSPEDIADVCYRTKYADVYIDAEGMPKRMPARLEETVGARGVKWPKQKLKKQAIIVTETGKIGVASCHVQRGNQVVVLFGAMTPFIIKQREPRVEAQIQANTYWLVGEW
jgi:hypothetical protein